MNIVFISEYTARELYVIEQVVKEYPSTVVVRPTYSSSELSQSRKIGSRSLKQFRGLAGDIFWKYRRIRWDQKFYPDNNYPDLPHLIEIPEYELHKSTGVKSVKNLEPDILITCRAPLIETEMIKVASKAAVNVHYGVAPYYRGNDTLFWPLYFNDFKHVGGCIHHLTEGIDTGNIVTEAYPSLESSDSEADIDYKTSSILARSLMLLLKAAENPDVDITGKSQQITGRNFKSGERTLKKSMKYMCRRFLGMDSPPWRKERIITHFTLQDKKNSRSRAVV